MIPTTDAIVEVELGEWMQQVKDAIFYARVAARSHGYALAVHGTLRRDVDVVAVPWTDEACDPDELAEHIVAYLISTELCYDSGAREHMQRTREQKPHGRLAYAIPLKGIPAPYLDLSIAPRVSQPAPRQQEPTRKAVEALQRYEPITTGGMSGAWCEGSSTGEYLRRSQVLALFQPEETP